MLNCSSQVHSNTKRVTWLNPDDLFFLELFFSQPLFVVFGRSALIRLTSFGTFPRFRGKARQRLHFFFVFAVDVDFGFRHERAVYGEDLHVHRGEIEFVAGFGEAIQLLGDPAA